MFKSAGFKLISSYFILHEDSHFSTAEFIKEFFFDYCMLAKSQRFVFGSLFNFIGFYVCNSKSSLLFRLFTFATYFKIRHFDVSSFVLLTQAVFGWGGPSVTAWILGHFSRYLKNASRNAIEIPLKLWVLWPAQAT